MNKKILKLLVIYMSLCFAVISINISGTTIVKTMGTLDGSITINPAEPNGDHNWYVTPVNVTFHAEDDIQLAYIYYRVSTEDETNPNWMQVDIRNQHTAEYDLTISINKDGVHIAIFYTVDHIGNIGPTHASDLIRIDMSPPEVSLRKEKISFNVMKFTANATDNTSDIYTIKFYVDDETEPRSEDTTASYEFYWKGIGTHTITAQAWDVAGNEALTKKTTSICFVFGGNTKVNNIHSDPDENYVDLQVLNKPLFIWENEKITIDPGAFVRLYQAKGLFLVSSPLCFGICIDWGIIG